MDLQVLRFFAVIARCGSFLHAAQTLGYAQSNLSMKIKQLEQELGTKLFLRTKQGVRLTTKGTLLLSYADKLLNLADEAVASLQGDEFSARTLAIGSMESAAITFLPKLLTKFHSLEPELQLTVETCVSRRATQLVLDHRLDGAFIAGGAKHHDLEAIELFQETLVLLTNAEQKPEQELNDLLALPLLVLPIGCTYRQVLENMVAQAGLVPSRIVEFHSLGALLASVSAGLGLALFPAATVTAFAAGQALTAHPIPAAYRSISIQFISRKNSCKNLTLEKFKQLCVSLRSNLPNPEV